MSKTIDLDIPGDANARIQKAEREHIMQFFRYDHLPVEKQAVSRPFGELAEKLVAELPRNPERTVALRKLLEAKDAAVRAGFAVGVLLAFLLPGLAFAQVAAPTKTTGQVILEGVLQYVVAPLLPIVGGLVAALLAKAVAYLNARQKESVGNLLAAKLTGAAASVVAELNATLRPQLEAALADGVLTDAEKKQLKDAAMRLLKTKLPADLLKATGQTFGELTDTYLGGLIERALNQEKATAAIAASRPPTP